MKTNVPRQMHAAAIIITILRNFTGHRFSSSPSFLSFFFVAYNNPKGKEIEDQIRYFRNEARDYENLNASFFRNLEIFFLEFFTSPFPSRRENIRRRNEALQQYEILERSDQSEFFLQTAQPLNATRHEYLKSIPLSSIRKSEKSIYTRI